MADANEDRRDEEEEGGGNEGNEMEEGEEGFEGGEVEEGGGEGGGVDENLLQNPNFLQFLLGMLQEETEKKDLARKVVRREAGSVALAALRSRRHELRALAEQALPRALHLGKDVWSLVLSFLRARELSCIASTCWYFRALCEDDSYWEHIYANEIGGVSLVTKQCSSFRERFFLSQKMEDIVAALATAEDGDEIILCPGVYERDERTDPYGMGGLKVRTNCHIIGCGFNLKFDADLNCNHAADLPKLRKPNIIVRSQYTNAIDWRSIGGAISNLHLEYVNPDPSKYFFALKIENEFPENESGTGPVLTNVSVVSTQQMAVSCQPLGRFTAVRCRFHSSEGSGLSVLEGGRVRLSRCIIDGNASGISISNGKVHMEECIVSNNRFSGIGVNGSQAALTMLRSNIFHHPLQGLEILNDVEAKSVQVENSHLHNNLNGILRWCPPEFDIASVTAELQNTNNVHDNRKGQVVARVLPLGKNLADMAIEANICTFVYTGPNFIEQTVYWCISCGLSGRSGCCKSCAVTCHAGHEVVEHTTTSFYCDCPSFQRGGPGVGASAQTVSSGCLHKQVVSEKVMEKSQYGSSK